MPEEAQLSLLIDDLRVFDTDFTARCYDDGIFILATQPIHTLILDHDFGDQIPGQDGAGVMQWLSSRTDRLPKHVVIVTSNTPGRANIISHISSLQRAGFDITYEVK